MIAEQEKKLQEDKKKAVPKINSTSNKIVAQMRSEAGIRPDGTFKEDDDMMSETFGPANTRQFQQPR